MKTNIFHLEVIYLNDILCHEEYDTSRTKPLVDWLKREQYLANPIIVAPLGEGKYLQLDGMTRLFSFKKLNIPSILAQIVDYNDQEIVELSSWTHLFFKEKEKMLNFIVSLEGVYVKKGKKINVGHRYIKEEGMGRLCTLVAGDGDVYLISTNGSLLEKVEKLRKIVSFYQNGIIRDVLPLRPNIYDIKVLFDQHRKTNFLLVFPTFTRHQIVDVVKRGGIFPAGVTRHLIKGRCLSVNVPLSLFKRGKSLEEKNKKLEQILKKRRFRVYEEPTVFFE